MTDNRQDRLLEDITSDKRRQFQKSSSERTVSRGLLWLWCEDSSGTQEGECPLLEAIARGLVKGQQIGKI
jgi:hypothetical protein